MLFKKSLCMFVAISCFSGCAYTPTRTFSYEPLSVMADSPQKTHGVLVVKELREARGERTYPNSMGNIFKTYIPLLPSVTMTYERLDESDRMTQLKKADGVETSRFTDSISKAIAEDLARSGFFKEVRYISNQTVPNDADFILSGDLSSTALDTSYTSYMLGMIGVLLWILPMPMARTSGHVEASLSVTDLSGQEIWRHQLKGQSKRTYTMYNSSGKALSSVYSLEIKHYGKNAEGVDGDSFWAYHAAALRVGMVDAKKSLLMKLSKVL